MLTLMFATVALSPLMQFSSSEVKFKGAGGFQLEGTLVRPPASFAGPRPAILLLPGSGPTDRDGNSGLGLTTNLLKQLAEQLAAHGIVSLRFDKRAVAHYQSQWPTDMSALADFFDWPMFTGDALAAYKFLRSQPRINSSKVAIGGHSEGGLITLQLAHDLANGPDDPAAIVLLSTAGRPMGDVIHQQLSEKLPQQLPDPARVKELVAYSDKACAALAAGQPLPEGLPNELRGLFNPTATKIVGAYCRIDPAAYAASYNMNALVVNGGDDTQVSPTLDAPRLRDALQKRPAGKVTFVVVPGVSHNYKVSEGANHDVFEGPASPAMLEAVTKFLEDNLNPAARTAKPPL